MKNVVIVGMGKMGSAIAGRLDAKYNVTGLDQGDDLSKVASSDIIVIAVKPQSFADLSKDLVEHIKNQTILSIMAGVNCQKISDLLNTDQVVRTMPNLGLAKGKSLTGVYALGGDKPAGIEELLKLWGQVVWLNKEDDFDAFTALAGSGPAYIFEMVAQLQISAEKLGFDQQMAQQIANSILMAAGAMSDNEPASDKVHQVASKGGTTEAALKVFAKRNFGDVIYEAVSAAAARSKELSI